MTLFSMELDKIHLGNHVRLFEAFSGIGTQAMALKRLGVNVEHIGFSEIDKYAIQSYLAIHGDVKNYGDITKMSEIPPCDIFTWSFPCTDLSKAGKQKGLDGTRSGLAYEVIRLLKVSEKPKVLLMENVPDLLGSKFRDGWQEIYHEIESLGYTNYVEVLNAKNYGVAQNRDRVFMVSILGEYAYEFPKPFKLEKRLKDYLEDEVDEKYYLSEKQLAAIINPKYESMGIDRIPSVDDDTSNAITTSQGGNREPKIVEPSVKVVGNVNPSGRGMNGNVFSGDLAPTLTTNKGEGIKIIVPVCLNSKVNGKQPSLQDRVYDTEAISTAITTAFMPSIAIPEATKQGYALAKDGDGVYINRPHQKRGVVQDGMIQTLKTSGDDVGVVVESNQEYDYIVKYENESLAIVVDTLNRAYVLDKKTGQLFRIRKLIPKEAWRLMSIDDEDFYKAQAVVSNSQLYKQAGNSIVVDVLVEIFRGLL